MVMGGISPPPVDVLLVHWSWVEPVPPPVDVVLRQCS